MTKTAALRVRISPELHQEFIEVCRSKDLSASHVLRMFMRTYVDKQINGQKLEKFDFNDEL